MSHAFFPDNVWLLEQGINIGNAYRLGKVVVEAGLQGLFLVLILSPSCDRDKQRASALRQCPNSLSDLMPRHAGHTYIQQHHVGLERFEQLQCLKAVVG